MKQFLVAGLLVLGVMSAQAEDRLIVVSGMAEKSMDPNMVQLNISVWSKANSAKQAQNLAAQTFKQVRKTLDEYKIKKEDVQTLGYTLSPNYEYDQKTRQNKLTGYQVNQTLGVILRKTEETGNFLNALIVDKKSNDSGVTVNSLTWDSDKRLQAQAAALGDAVRAAKVKAEEIAKAAGVSIKKVSKITHNAVESAPQPEFRNFAKVAMDSVGGTAVEAGQVTVRVEVSAAYEIQ